MKPIIQRYRSGFQTEAVKIALQPEETDMLRKLTRVDLLQAHTVLVGHIEDHEVVPFELCEPTADEIRARASDIYELLDAVLDYADAVMSDIYAHLGAATLYAPPHLAAMRNETTVLHKLLTAHADVIEKRGQYKSVTSAATPADDNSSESGGGGGDTEDFSRASHHSG